MFVNPCPGETRIVRLPRPTKLNQRVLGSAVVGLLAANAFAAAVIAGDVGGSVAAPVTSESTVPPAAPSPGPQTVTLITTTDGRAVGQVLISDGPDRMVCVLDGAPAGVRYAVTVSGEDGIADVGTFTSAGPGMPWSTSLPIDAADVRRVVIRDAAGTVRATADL
jgi:hypothetical protein